MKQKIYYKVVSPELKSCVMMDKFASEVQYIENQWVRAPKWLAKRKYHLLVFSSEAKSLEFISDTFRLPSETKLYECQIKGIRLSLPARIHGWFLVHPDTFDYCIRGDFTKSSPEWPDGTIMAKQVMLLKEVATAYKNPAISTEIG